MKNELSTPLNKDINNSILKDYLSSGCDERIFTNQEGQIKYWINLFEYNETVHRGSCTCGTLNDDNIKKT